MRAPVVLLDACVLVPHNLMSILLTCAEHGLIEIRWSERILTEVQRTLVKDLDLSSAAAERRIQAMRDAFPEAAVEGYERFEGAMHCHRKDRHVLAAAVAAEADVLVTFDLRDFPENGLPAHDLVVQHPEQLLGGVRRDSLAEVIDHESRRRLHAPKLFSEILAALAPGMPTLANVLHQWALVGRPTASEVPGIVPPVEGEQPLHGLDHPDLRKPDHVVLGWWSALLDDDQELLRALTSQPRNFGDYRSAKRILDDMSLASKVWFAVDAPEDLAFMRFVPGTTTDAKVFASSTVSSMVFIILVRELDDTWRVWGLGPRLVSWNDVRR